jgi:hypothetical protein
VQGVGRFCSRSVSSNAGRGRLRELPGDFLNHVAKIQVPQQNEDDEDQKPSIVWVEKNDLPPSVHRSLMTGTTPWKARTVAILAGLGILLVRVAGKIFRWIGLS